MIYSPFLRENIWREPDKRVTLTDFINNLPTVKVKRRKQRKYQTDAEALLWQYVRARKLGGYKFYRQFSVGQFILDFYCAEKKLAIELDGEQHFDREEYDFQRTVYLENKGIRVIRFWNSEVVEKSMNVCEIILRIIEQR